MAQVTRADSKLKFQTGDVPTESDFVDLHDSVKWYDEGGGGVSDGDKGDIVVSGSGSVWTLEDQFKKTNALNIYSALGSAIKAEPLWGIAQMNANLTLSNSSICLVPVWLPLAASLTGVKWWQNTTGVYTGSNYNGVGLYTYSAGTLTLVASSTNDSEIWKAAVGWASKAFTSPYSAAVGLYYVAALYSRSAQTTGPSLGGINTISGMQTVDFTNGALLNGSLTSQTSLPSSFSISSAFFSQNHFCLTLY